MSLQQTIEEKFLVAFKAKQAEEVSTLRMLKSALLNKKIEKRLAKEDALPDEEVIAMVKSEIKKRLDSIEAYTQGNRNDLAAKEQKEIEILSQFVPEQMSEEKLKELVAEVIKELGASNQSEFGKVMGAVMAKAKGQADGTAVAKAVKETLGK